MISSSNFVAIARVFVLARKDPGTTSPFSSLLDLVTLTCTFVLTAGFLKKGEYKEGKFHRHVPNKFDISFKVSPLTEHLPSVFVTVVVSVIARF